MTLGGGEGREGRGGVLEESLSLSFSILILFLIYVYLRFFFKCTSSVGGYGIMGRGGKVS